MVLPVDVQTDGVENCIKAIGQTLINNSKAIANSTKPENHATKINIKATIEPDAVVTIDVTTSYYAMQIKEDENV